MRKLLTILAAVMLVGLVVPAFSAVENVKVGGDIVVKGIYRNNFDLQKKIAATGAAGDGNSYIYTGARVYVSAELSDNVSAMLRFVDERDWSGLVGMDIVSRTLSTDLAYVKVSDLVVPGLNLTVGRQEIQIGDGLVVGSQYRASMLNRVVSTTYYYDYGLQKAFDAIKLDYAFTAAPVTVTAFKAKITEAYDNAIYVTPLGTIGNANDGDLYGLDVVISAENVKINPYYVYETISTNGTQEPNVLSTAGIRATWAPMEALSLSGEYAKQFGSDKTAPGKPDYEGWALVLGASYKFETNMSPVVSAMYADFSGQKATATDIKQWVPVFPSNIASRVGKIAYPAIFSGGEGAFDLGSGSGVRVIKLGLGLQPAEKVGLTLDWYNLTAKETGAGIDDSVGNEIDLGITYKYSEDLSFGLDLGYFMAGDYVEDTFTNQDKNAWQAIVTMSVAF
ncbi:MAG: alginate export family protein [Candidatus Omnitrophica bacterium]|nr:alginate export family protein [Candidatus Omnitrophota bacterium]MCM8829007.1 alginate export family protein [Candidatus Omnitrophota bacterium]